MPYPSVDAKETAVEIIIRHTEPEDYEALHEIMSSPKVMRGTLQLPLPSKDLWRGRLAEPPEGIFSLVALVEGVVVGNIGLMTQPVRWRRRHTGKIGMAVRNDWHGKGIGVELMRAALDLADNWLSLSRIELEVYTDNAPPSRSTKSSGSRSKELTAATHFATVSMLTPIRWPASAGRQLGQGRV